MIAEVINEPAADEAVSMYPEEWQVVRLSNVAKFASGGTPSRERPEYYTGSTLWIKSGELNDGYIEDTEEKITEAAVKNSAAKVFTEGTLLMAMYGATAGRTAITKVPAATNQAVCAIFPGDELVSEFLGYFLIFYRPFILNQRHGGAQPNISQTVIKNLEIPLPPLPEQRAIARVLSTVQAAIAKQDELIQTTQALKKALMHKLFTEGLNNEPTKETEIGPVPESWDVVPIGQVYATTSKPRAVNVKGTAMVPFVPMEYVPDRGVYCDAYIPKNGNELTSGTYVENGDLLLAKITPSFENGKQCILNVPSDWAYATTEVIPIKEIVGVSSKLFLFYYLLRPQVRNRLAGLMEGTTGRQRLNKTTLFNYLIPLPSPQEQETIGNTIAVLDQRIDQHHTRKQTLEALFRTLLHELMTGQRRVTV